MQNGFPVVSWCFGVLFLELVCSQDPSRAHLHQRRVRDDVEALRRERVPDREGDPGRDDDQGERADVPPRGQKVSRTDSKDTL